MKSIHVAIMVLAQLLPAGCAVKQDIHAGSVSIIVRADSRLSVKGLPLP